MRFLLVFVLMVNILQAKKIALLIGNSDYSFAPLANPLHDVDKLYKTLDEIGFDDIKVLKNASKTEMDNALLNFEEKAQSTEIALIYFSGHGMQVNSINYMFPARTTVTKPIHLKKLVDLEMFIQSATSARYGIVLIDACRDNPLVKYFQNGRYKGASAKKGLGQVTPTNGQIVIGFATRAGETADDGYGNISPYAKALANRLKERDDIRNILGKVALDVSKKYNQYPIYKANLAYDVILSKKSHKIPEIKKPKVEIVETIDTPKFTNISKVVNKDIVVIDGLMYQNQPFSTIDKYNFDTQQEGSRVWRRQEEKANNYCKSLTIDNYTHWRLPTKKELENLLTRKKHGKYNIRQEFIKNMPPLSGRFPWASFWTSTEKNSKTWVVNLNSGHGYWFDTKKTDAVYVLCVKDK